VEKVITEFLATWAELVVRAFTGVFFRIEISAVRNFSLPNIGEKVLQWGTYAPVAIMLDFVNDVAEAIQGFQNELIVSLGAAAVQTAGRRLLMPKFARTTILTREKAITEVMEFLIRSGVEMSTNGLPLTTSLFFRVRALKGVTTLAGFFSKLVGFKSLSSIIFKAVEALLLFWIQALNFGASIFSVVLILTAIGAIEDGSLFPTLSQGHKRKFMRVRVNKRL